MIEACKDAEISIAYQNGEQHCISERRECKSRLRTEEVGNMASVRHAPIKWYGKNCWSAAGNCGEDMILLWMGAISEQQFCQMPM